MFNISDLQPAELDLTLSSRVEVGPGHTFNRGGDRAVCWSEDTGWVTGRQDTGAGAASSWLVDEGWLSFCSKALKCSQDRLSWVSKLVPKVCSPYTHTG